MENIKLIDYNSNYKAQLDTWSDIEKQQGINGIERFVATEGYKLGEYVDYFSTNLDAQSKLAFDNDILIGFVLYSQNKDVAHIEIMATNPEMRGRGYAIKIVQQLKTDLQSSGINKITLEVNKKNKPALRTFSKITKPNSKYSTTNYEGMELV